MRITRENLVRIAKETVQKRAYADPNLVAAYLTGSLRTDNPFLGNATDIDLVFVHAGPVKVRREIVPLTPEIHLDIVHNPRTAYEKPKELRIHPWLGPELYDPQPLHVTQHFFEFIQAGVRDKFHDAANVLARARPVLEHARQLWSELQTSALSGPALLLPYLKSVHNAAKAIATLAESPLSERRLLLQFPGQAQAVGVPELAEAMSTLTGAGQGTGDFLQASLPAWEKDFLSAAGRPRADVRICAARLGYYKLAFEALMACENPQAITWPLVRTWTWAAAALPVSQQGRWLAAMTSLGLAGVDFGEQLENLDHFLDNVEELLENKASGQ